MKHIITAIEEKMRVMQNEAHHQYGKDRMMDMLTDDIEYGALEQLYNLAIKIYDHAHVHPYPEKDKLSTYRDLDLSEMEVVIDNLYPDEE